MSFLINKTIEIKGRNWVVLGFDEYLEVFFVRECGRQFKTVIGFEEIPTVVGLEEVK